MKIKTVTAARLPYTNYESPTVEDPVRLRTDSKVISVTTSDNIVYVHLHEPDLTEFNGELYDPTVLWTWHLKIAGDTVQGHEWYVGTVKFHPNDLHIYATWNDDIVPIYPEPLPTIPGDA